MDCDPIEFNPRLYIQRDERIIELVNDYKDVTHVLEIGCGECRLINRLKQSINLQRIIGVDLSRSSLEDNFLKLKPLSWDFIQRRDKPLIIELYQGDILKLDKEFSKHLEHQVLILTEVIEHLLIEDLDTLAHSLFHLLSSPIIIITTPNYEFNVCFGHSETKRFRHYDHKFEWTRAEFQEWCNDKALRNSYSVIYDGVGDPPSTHPTLGSCTQFAIFEKIKVPQSDFMPNCIDLSNPNNLSNPNHSANHNHLDIPNKLSKLIDLTIPNLDFSDSKPFNLSNIDKKVDCSNLRKQLFELVVRIEYPCKESFTEDSVREDIENSIKKQSYELQMKHIDQDNSLFSEQGFKDALKNSDGIYNISLQCSNGSDYEESDDTNGFIEDGYAYISVVKLFEKKIKDYFEGNLLKFKDFLKANSFTLEDSLSYIKHEIEDTYSNSEGRSDDDDDDDDDDDKTLQSDDNYADNNLSSLEEDENWD